MNDEFQETIDALYKVISELKSIKVSSELLEKMLPNFHFGMQLFIEDLAKERGNKEILKLVPKYNAVLEIEPDGEDFLLLVKVPMLERILNDPDAYLTEYVSALNVSEMHSLRKLDLLD